MYNKILKNIRSPSQKLKLSDTNLIVTEPPLNFTSIQEAWDEVIFEEYGFKSLFRSVAVLIVNSFLVVLFGYFKSLSRSVAVLIVNSFLVDHFRYFEFLC